MATIPPLERFIAQGENQADKWMKYKRAFGYYAASLNVADSKVKRDLLLHIAGQDLQEIYETFVFPNGPQGESPDPTFDETVAKFDVYFNPKRNVIYERFEFASISWVEGDTTDSFITRLKQAATYCEFPDKDDRIRDHFVYKCFSTNLRKRFLREPSLTLESLSTIARAYESSNKQGNKMAGVREFDESLNQVKKTSDQNDRNDSLNIIHADNFKGRCLRCARRGHLANQCEIAKGKICSKCGWEGHFATCCHTREEKYKTGEVANTSRYNVSQQKYKNIKERKCPGKVQAISKKPVTSESSDEDYVLVIGDESSYKVNALVNKKKASFIVDTGATVNVISEEVWLNVKKDQDALQSTKARVFAYGMEEPLKILGQCSLTVECNGMETGILFVIVTGKYQCLFGKKISQYLGLVKFPELKYVNSIQEVGITALVKKYDHLFEGIGKLKDFEANVELREGCMPIIQRMRRYPYHLRAKIREEIKRLKNIGIIERVKGDTKWLTPMVVVLKKDGTVRLCLDMRKPNQIINKYKYPIPLVDDVLQDFEGAEYFTELDLNEGFHQLGLNEQSRDITTFNTEDGMYRYTRLIYGMCTAPEIFQETIENVIRECEGTRNISDNIVVFGKNYKEHFERLEKLLKILSDKNITLNKNKCHFGVRKLDFMGYIVSRYGIRLGRDKIKHILESREPKDVSEVRSFLGLVNFCSKFLPNVAHMTAPLRELTRKNTYWQWGLEQKEAFKHLKETIASVTELTYFDVNNKTILFVDAGPEGLGAVLTQIQRDGQCKPIAFASKALTLTEKAYSQTEKEALACIWGCEHFHNYLYGAEFTIVTDHKPLEIIYSPNSRPSARIERWIIRLQQYKYRVEYRKGCLNIADPFSRLLNDRHQSERSTFMGDRTERYLAFVTQEAVPKAITEEVIRKSTEKDRELQLVKAALITNRWPETIAKYKQFRGEFTIYKGLLLRNKRIVIPSQLRKQVLSIAHETHVGIVRMKAAIRSKVWWPNYDAAVEEEVKTCVACQVQGEGEKPVPLFVRETSLKPWQSLALDICGPFPSGEYLIVLVDYSSKWPEACIVKSITTLTVTKWLDSVFATHGYPEEIRCDNGTQFRAREFGMFLGDRGIKLHNVTPYWPQANGQVERLNKVFLKTLRAAVIDKHHWQQEVENFLRVYRSTPHTVTGVSPAKLLFGREIRTKLPDIQQWSGQRLKDLREAAANEKWRKLKEKEYADKKRCVKTGKIKVGDWVYVKQQKRHKLMSTFAMVPWFVIGSKGNQITLRNAVGRSIVRPLAHVKKIWRKEGSEAIPNMDRESDTIPNMERESDMEGWEEFRDIQVEEIVTQEGTSEEEERRYPTRERIKPVYLKDYVCDYIQLGKE